MRKKYIIMYEISQKQNYIFRSNKLIENTGASYIIRDLTENPHQLFNKINDSALKKVLAFKDSHKDLPHPVDKIVGGGNATYIFDDKVEAKEFAQVLSSNVLRYFPGLELFLVKDEIEWNREALNGRSGFYQKLKEKLSNKKNQRKYTVYQKSWGIHQVCQRSGLPAYEQNEDGENWSKEFLVKRELGKIIRNDRYRHRFILDNKFLSDDLAKREKYEFVKHEDWENTLNKERGGKASKSYLSIISVDGNSMGVKIDQFFKDLDENIKNKDTMVQKNELYIEAQKQLSLDIDNFFTQAFQKTIAHVMKDFDRWAESIYGKDIFEKANENTIKKAKKIIPIRPVIFSGDDVSFITYGVLGLEITRIFLQYLQEKPIKIGNKKSKLNACAGVSIIPFRFPFWLGFELADNLCNHAKARLQNDAIHWKKHAIGDGKTPYDTSLIDWQLIEKGGSISSISDFRDKYYRTRDENEEDAYLTMRPYYIQHKGEKKKHFANYERTFLTAIDRMTRSIAASKSHDSEAASASKWKQLRDVYHQGVNSVKQWVLLNRFKALAADYEYDNPFKNEFFLSYNDGFGLLHQMQDSSGNKYAFYYDALEIYDYFVRLSEVK